MKVQNSTVAYLNILAEHTYAIDNAAKEKLNDLIAVKTSLLDAAFKDQPFTDTLEHGRK